MTRQLLMQPVGLIKRPPSRGRLRPLLRRLDAKTAGVGNKPVIVMTARSRRVRQGSTSAAKKKSSTNMKTRLKIRTNYYVVGPNLGCYTQWVRWHTPTRIRTECLLWLSAKSAVRLASSRKWELKAAAQMLW